MTIEQVLQAGGKCSHAEYNSILQTLNRYKVNGCNMLIFGTGHDTRLWLHNNQKGKTFVVENHPKWYELTRKLFRKNPNATLIKVQYLTRADDYKVLLKTPEKLEMQLPTEVLTTPYQVIFVDGPVGKTVGRMKSIYMAARLARESRLKTHVFVHDYYREREKYYCDHLLGEPHQVVEKMAHFIVEGPK